MGDSFCVANISGSKLSSNRKSYLVDSGAKLLAAQPWAAAVLLVAGLAIVAIVVSAWWVDRYKKRPPPQ